MTHQLTLTLPPPPADTCHGCASLNPDGTCEALLGAKGGPIGDFVMGQRRDCVGRRDRRKA